MSKEPKANEVSAGNFIAEMMSDILSASDGEILEDDEEISRSSGTSAEDFVSHALDAAMISIGKKRFQEAARDLEKSTKATPTAATLMDRQRLRRMYGTNHQKSGLKLSMAARGGTKISERDLDSAIEDLTELGGLDEKIAPEK